MAKKTTGKKKTQSKKTRGTSHARAQAGKIAKDRKDIRAKIRNLVLETISEKNITLDHLSELANEVLEGATESLSSALPSSRRSGLRQVIEGISDAWAVTAKASAASVRHAKKYGLKLAQQDIKGLTKRLMSLEEEFLQTVERFAGRLKNDLAGETKSLITRLRATGTAITPAVKTASTAIAEHGTELIGEVASASMKASQQALSGALLAVSGLLEGVGEALRRGNTKK